MDDSTYAVTVIEARNWANYENAACIGTDKEYAATSKFLKMCDEKLYTKRLGKYTQYNSETMQYEFRPPKTILYKIWREIGPIPKS